MHNFWVAFGVWLLALGLSFTAWPLGGFAWYWVVAFLLMPLVPIGVFLLETYSTIRNRRDPTELEVIANTAPVTPEPRNEHQPAPAGALQLEESGMERTITYLAALAALATTALVPVLYVVGLDEVEIRGVMVSFISVGLIVFAVDAVLNIISGMTKQTDPTLNRIDSGVTKIRTISITGTAVIVLILLYRVGDPTVKTVMSIPNAWTLLGILLAFTWVDLLIIQGALKNRRLAKFTRRSTTATTTATGGGALPDETYEMMTGSGQPELAVRPTILIDKDNPRFVVREGDGFVEVNPDDYLPRFRMRAERFLGDPRSVGVQLLEDGRAIRIGTGRIVDHDPPAPGPRPDTPAATT